LQSLASNPVSRRVDIRRPVVIIVAESLSQYEKQHVVPTPLSGISIGKRENISHLHDKNINDPITVYSVPYN
jgi:hypothetical protein